MVIWSTVHQCPFPDQVQCGSFEGIRVLVKECGADVETRGESDCNALISAATFGRSDVVEFLVKKCGAIVEVVDAERDSALDLALMNCQPGTVKVLQEAQAPVGTCRICHENWTESELPSRAACLVKCEACKKSYHRKCLFEWFAARGSVRVDRMVDNEVSMVGKCPV